jgi:hypothetical protein
MSRATFEGPVLSGDNRFGPLRNVGYARLSQQTFVDYSVATGNGTAGYPGAAQQFVNGNVLSLNANVNSPVYTPSSSTFPSVLATIPADTATNIYRGVVMYLPVGAQIESIICDYLTAITVGNATLSAVNIYVSNGYTAAAGTPAYATIALGTTTVGTVGRQTTTYSAANLLAMDSTTTDILQPAGQPALSQVVFTLSIVGTTLTTLSAGKFNLDVNYVQSDGSLGTKTVYPFGNTD